MSTPWDGLEALQARARRRRWMQFVPMLVVVVVVVVGEQLAGRHHGNNRLAAPHGHPSALAQTLGFGLPVLVVLAVLALVVRASRRRTPSLLSARLALGLSWRDRRAVSRAIRRGVLPADPAVAAAAADTSTRTVRAEGLLVTICAVSSALAVPLGISLASQHLPAPARGMGVVVAAMAPAALGWSIWWCERARRYVRLIPPAAAGG